MTRAAILYIFRAGDTYTTSLEASIDSPAGLVGTVAVADEDRRDVVLALERTVAAEEAGAGFDVAGLESVGQIMCRLFLPRSVQEFLRAWDGPLTISTNDPTIPWELLHTGRGFIGLRHAVGRRVLSERRPPSQPPGPERDRPAFLFVADPRGDLPGAAAEARELAALLSQRGLACDLLAGDRASYLNVQAALGAARYDVIHYAGHAQFSAGNRDSALELAGERLLPASQIERALRGTPVVFLNACWSAQLSQEDRRQRPEANATLPLASRSRITEGLASAFVFGGAQGFIGALWAVPDAGSRAFATFFYQRLVAGDAVGEALRAARQRLRDQRPDDAAWTAFVLYGDPTYRLGGTPAEATALVAPPMPADEHPHQVTPARQGARARETPSVPEAQTVSRKESGARRLLLGLVPLLIVAAAVVGLVWWTRGGAGAGNALSVASATAPPVAVVGSATLSTTTTTRLTVTATHAVAPVAKPETVPPATATSTRLPTATAAPLATPTGAGVALGSADRLAFVSRPSSGLTAIYTANADGSNLEELGPGTDPDWSPDGARLAFAGLLETQPGIFVVDADGGGSVQLTDASDWQPTWSPDGSSIAFMSLRTGDREIYVMGSDGSGLSRISNNPWQDRHPAWSPRGQQIAFISNRSGSWQVWLMNADGSGQRRLTDNDYDNFRPVWSPDGRRIAFGVWTGERNEVWVMDANGQDQHMVTARAVYRQEFAGYGLAWEPQDFISFVSDRTTRPQVYVMEPDGSGQQAVTDVASGAFSPAWSPN